MAFDNSCTKAVLSASPGPTPKRCEPPLFLAALGQAIRGWKALGLESLNRQFQQDWPKENKYSSCKFLPENLKKINHSPLESSRLGELKQAISAD